MEEKKRSSFDVNTGSELTSLEVKTHPPWKLHLLRGQFYFLSWKSFYFYENIPLASMEATGCTTIKANVLISSMDVV